jgi:hypothetical protein
MGLKVCQSRLSPERYRARGRTVEVKIAQSVVFFFFSFWLCSLSTKVLKLWIDIFGIQNEDDRYLD